MIDNEKAARREAMMAKVRKLLAMAKDGRGNEHEEAIAMRQANKLMAEYGIAEAECDINALDANEMVFGEVKCGPDGRVPERGNVVRRWPSWCGILALGVARFTDTVCILGKEETGKVLKFRGEQNDCLFARWLFGVLVESVQREQVASGWTKRGESEQFRGAAAGVLQRRLGTLAQERRAAYQDAQRESGSRALVVVDRKQAQITALFGQQRTTTHRSSGSYSGAYSAGQSAGGRINIPAGRPVGTTTQARIAA